MEPNGSALPRRRYLGAAALALVGAAVLWFGTPHGLGLSPDSVGYLRSAEHWLAAGGAAEVTGRWPPGYSWLLAVSTFGVIGPLEGGRLLHALLMAANLWLFVALTRRLAPGHWPLALLGGAVMLQPVWLRPHLVLWSEPAFLVAVQAHLLLLLTLPQRASPGRLVALALLAAVALLLRYAGGFLLLLDLVVILLWSAWPARRSGRAVAALSVACSAALPLLAWLALREAGGGETPRQLAWHPPDGGAVKAVGATVAGWFALPKGAWLAGLALLVAVLGPAARPAAAIGARLLALATLAYLAFLFASITWFDANTPLDDRLLLPVFVLLVALLVAHAASARSKAARLAWLAPLLAFAWGASEGTRLWLASRHDGLGMASRQVRASPVLAHLQGLPAERRVYTNGPELFTIHLRREASMLPRGIDLKTRRPNPDFGSQMDRMAAQADVLVWFSATAFREYLPPPEVIDRVPGFVRSYEAADGVVWVRSTPAP